MKDIILGLVREGKNPPDKRVPLTPKQCVQVQNLFPQVKIIVQTSQVRAIPDQEYRNAGIVVQEDMNNCDILMGVKEVNIADLIPNKTYLFFSHTIKKQPYNRGLLQAILEKRIRLIDYEVLKDTNRKRIIGFGRYAGIVGCYNAFLTFGLKAGLYELKPAHQCLNRVEMESELSKVKLPVGFKMVLTGFGRVGNGAQEIMQKLGLKRVSPAEFLEQNNTEPIYTHLDTNEYYRPKNGNNFDKVEFYSNPENYEACLHEFTTKADVYVACHFWNNKSPLLLTQEQLKNSSLKVIADVSCDIAGPIASTIRASKIADPIYGYDPATGEEVDFKQDGAIAVMAVDNLPCELPMDASEDFGNELIRQVFPHLFGNDELGIIENGSETTKDGKLTPLFAYLHDYVLGH